MSIYEVKGYGCFISLGHITSMGAPMHVFPGFVHLH